MRLDNSKPAYLPRKWEEEQGLEEAKQHGRRALICETHVVPDAPESSGLYGRQGIQVKIDPQ